MSEKDKKKLKKNKNFYLVSGIIFIFFSIVFIPIPFLCTIVFIIGCTLLFLSHSCNKAYKNSLIETKQAVEIKPESPYIFLSFKVAGVTFKNGRKTRQAILRAFKWGDEEIETITLEPYEYEGRPAVYVKINDQIVGNIPSEHTLTFLEYEEKYNRDNIHCEVYGGTKLDDGSRTNYGCELYIRYRR